jgi:DnaJ-class molecular chaperone
MSTSMADRDYYELLEVARTASADDIKKSYRRLARQHHPDLNPNDRAGAEKKFKEIQNAYDVLGDPEKKKLYDLYGTAAFQGGGPGAAGAGARSGGGWQPPPGAESFDFSDLFGAGGPEGFQTGGGPGGGGAGIFDEILTRRRGGGGGRAAGPRPGADVTASITVPFLTAVTGGEMPILLQRGTGEPETLTVKVPPGTINGAKLRLRGKGEPSRSGGPAGDLTVTVEVQTHPYFTRDGRNLLVDLPLSVPEAVLGAKVDVPTLDGMKSLNVPAGASSGQKLRLKGQGVPASGGHAAGDLMVVLKIIAPKSIDEESRALIEQFAERNPQAPRRDLW